MLLFLEHSTEYCEVNTAATFGTYLAQPACFYFLIIFLFPLGVTKRKLSDESPWSSMWIISFFWHNVLKIFGFLLSQCLSVSPNGDNI